jgi:hypothetical protein
VLYLLYNVPSSPDAQTATSAGSANFGHVSLFKRHIAFRISRKTPCIVADPSPVLFLFPNRTLLQRVRHRLSSEPEKEGLAVYQHHFSTSSSFFGLSSFLFFLFSKHLLRASGAFSKKWSRRAPTSMYTFHTFLLTRSLTTSRRSAKTICSLCYCRQSEKS